MKKVWKTYAFWIVFTEVIGALSGFLTREGTQIYAESLRKPPLSPPGIVFLIVWPILYALMGIGAARISLQPDSSGRTRSILLFLAQLLFNFFWSIIFFTMQAYGFAWFWLIALWLLVILMIFSFQRQNRLAAILQIPYFLWLTFAANLNFGVWSLNM